MLTNKGTLLPARPAFGDAVPEPRAQFAAAWVHRREGDDGEGAIARKPAGMDVCLSASHAILYRRDVEGRGKKWDSSAPAGDLLSQPLAPHGISAGTKRILAGSRGASLSKRRKGCAACERVLAR